MLSDIQNTLNKNNRYAEVKESDSSLKEFNYRLTDSDYYTVVTAQSRLEYKLKQPIDYLDISNAAQAKAAEQKNKQALSPAEAAIDRALTRNGFKESTAFLKTDMTGDERLYISNSEVCYLYNMTIRITILCSPVKAFIEEAAADEPFAQLYLDHIVKDDNGIPIQNQGNLLFGHLKTGTGETNKDVYATLFTGDATSYYYKENGNWVYFGSSQEGIDCDSSFSSAAEQRAFVHVCSHEYLP